MAQFLSFSWFSIFFVAELMSIVLVLLTLKEELGNWEKISVKTISNVFQKRLGQDFEKKI